MLTDAEINRFAAALHYASGEYLEQLPRATAAFGMIDPAPALTENTGWQEMRDIGARLAVMSDDAMSRVYDSAVETYGYRGVRGVNSAWTGIGGWQA